ncbi:MAG: methionyl-tRNA formyltransferase [Deltaproteobacteria bacterium]|nr:methionyl-tRNA formyltransferase [Deltaproteobacteria bacterium]
MRIIYMGSPQASILPLEFLLRNDKRRHEVVAVVSQAAKEVGRGRHPLDPPLAAYAKEKSLLTFQPQKAREPEFLESISKLAPDIIITCAYGQILTDAFLAIPKRATINIHPSLLPQYRGATPVQSALLDGSEETGVTILFTVKALDAGNIIVQKTFPILHGETAGELTRRLFALSCPLLEEALKTLEDKAFIGRPQDERNVTLCRKIQKEDGEINWQGTKKTIENRFRAYHPWPGSFTFLGTKRIIVPLMSISDKTGGEEPGRLDFSKTEKALFVACADGWMRVHELKPEGARALAAVEFWNGLRTGDRAGKMGRMKD